MFRNIPSITHFPYLISGYFLIRSSEWKEKIYPQGIHVWTGESEDVAKSCRFSYLTRDQYGNVENEENTKTEQIPRQYCALYSAY